MEIKIYVEAVFLEENLPDGKTKEKFVLISHSYENLNEVVKCILQSGYIIRMYKIFG